MRHLVEFLIVSEKFVLVAPKAFQDYVAKYFSKKEVGGQTCFCAFFIWKAAEVPSIDENKSPAEEKETAPEWLTDLMTFNEGLPDGTHLDDFIKANLNKDDSIQGFQTEWNYDEPSEQTTT